MNKPRKPLSTLRTFPVKTYEIDFAGHVSNIVYIKWLEDLRLALLDAYYPLEAGMQEGVAPVLSRTEIEYTSPIHLFEIVTGELWATEIGHVRMTLAARFSVGDRLCATATQRGVFASMESGRPVRVPSPLRSVYLEQAGIDV